jgi:hypothetical protein
MSATMGGGGAYKAPHKATWYAVAEALTPTVWHDGGLIPNVGLKNYVVTPDCKSSSGWVRHMVAPDELLTTYGVPVDDQTRLMSDWCVKFLPTLQGH